MDAIVEAAARVLAKHGYAAATTNRLAEAAGVSIGTLYEYFANREEVFDALIRRELDALVVAFAREEFDPGSGIVEKLTQLIAAGMLAMPHGPELFSALEHVPGASFRRQLAGAREEVVRFIRNLFEEHRSELVVSDLDLAAFVAVSAVEGIAANTPNDRFDARLAGELERLLRGYLTGPVAEETE